MWGRLYSLCTLMWVTICCMLSITTTVNWISRGCMLSQWLAAIFWNPCQLITILPWNHGQQTLHVCPLRSQFHGWIGILLVCLNLSHFKLGAIGSAFQISSHYLSSRCFCGVSLNNSSSPPCSLESTNLSLCSLFLRHIGSTSLINTSATTAFWTPWPSLLFLKKSSQCQTEHLHK